MTTVVAAIVSVISVFVAIFVPVWQSNKSAEDALNADSISRRASVYQDFLGAVVRFDVAVTSLARSEEAATPVAERSTAREQFAASYTALGEAAWGIEMAATTPGVKNAKECIALIADAVYDRVRQGRALSSRDALTLGGDLTDRQNEFSRSTIDELSVGRAGPPAPSVTPPRDDARCTLSASSPAPQAAPDRLRR